VPLLIGTVSQDVSTTWPDSKDEAFEWFGADEEKARAVYDPQGKARLVELFTSLGADRTMHEPARFVARRITESGAPAWLYRFDYAAESLRPKTSAATHASEVPYLFDTLDAAYGDATTPRDRAAARAFHEYAANFVRTGDPNGPGLPPWRRFDVARFELMMFTPVGAAEMQEDPWRQRLELVERAVEARRP
jgi:para-nitrobenzyl esterase